MSETKILKKIEVTDLELEVEKYHFRGFLVVRRRQTIFASLEYLLYSILKDNILLFR